MLLLRSSCTHAAAHTPAEATERSFVAPRGGPGRCQPSPKQRRVGLRIMLFEACSAFTRVAACVLAEPPEAALLHRSASVPVVTSNDRSDCYRLLC